MNVFSNMRSDHQKILDEINTLEMQYESVRDIFSFKKSSRRNINILIYENNKVDAEQVLSVLHRNGIRKIVLKRSGDNWEDDLNNYSPKIILIGMALRSKNGYAILREISSHPEHKSIPMVIISNVATLVEATWARKCGAIDIVKKPISNDKIFIDRLDNILKTTIYYSFDFN